MKNINWYKLIPWIVGGIVLIFALSALFKQCTPKKVIEKIEVSQPDTAALNKAARWEDSARRYLQGWEDSKKQAAKTEKKLVASVQESKVWQGRYREARGRKDTTGSLYACDGLVKENDSLYSVIGQYQEDMNGIIEMSDLGRQAADSAALYWGAVARKAQQNELVAVGKYNALVPDYNAQNKTLRRAQGKNKVLGGTTAAMLIYIAVDIIKQ